MITSMDLVGSEVDVVVADASSSSSSTGQERSAAMAQQAVVDADAFDSHRSLTPPSAAESLFLPGLPTNTISAMALAAQIHERHRPLSFAGSVLTGDYQTANGSPETERDDGDLSSLLEHPRVVLPQFYSFPTDTINMNKSSSSQFLCSYPEEDNPFAKDFVVHARQQPHISYEEFKEDNFQDTMSEPMHIDPAEKVYDTAKGVWAWGKGIVIFSPFMGLAENLAGKIVETAGSTLAQVDSTIIDKLHGLDDGILNPAVETLVKTVMGAAHKTEDFVKPIILALLKPIGLIKDTPTTTTTTTTSTPLKKPMAPAVAPEVTSYAAAAK